MIRNPQEKSGLKNNQKVIAQKKTKIDRLKQLLTHNQQIQQGLKSYRDSIQERMQAIDQYITTHRLKEEYPVDSSLISYIRYDRKPPQTLKDQIALRQTELLRLAEDNHFDARPQQSPNKKKKTKQLNLALLPKNPKIIRFQQLAHSSGYSSGLEVYRQWFDFNKVKTPKAPYTIKEQQEIVKLQNKYGNSWEKICNYLQERTFDEVYYQFHNRLNPKIVSGRWTVRQSLMLIVLLEHFGCKSWSLIGGRMIVKSELQVRQRYCNMIDPNIGKDNYWTADMQAALMEAAPQYEYCWQRISRLSVFQNKTDNCIWRKFREMMITKSKEEIREIIQNKGARGLADKIISYKETRQSRNRRLAPPSNQKFDPNQRARQNRQRLQEGVDKEVSSNRIAQEESQHQNKPEVNVEIEFEDSSLQYIRYK